MGDVEDFLDVSKEHLSLHVGLWTFPVLVLDKVPITLNQGPQLRGGMGGCGEKLAVGPVPDVLHGADRGLDAFCIGLFEDSVKMVVHEKDFFLRRKSVSWELTQG